MKIAILGFGEEGRSLLRFLKKDPRYKGAEIRILDKKLDKNYLKNLDKFDLVFRSPGIPWNLPELKRARRNGVRFSSATRLFFEKCPARIIGVTGSKGKTTTATLLYKMLQAGGKRVFLAGNIGTSPLNLLAKLRKNDWIVLELSSFQLQDLNRSPHVAVLLTLFPEHLDMRGGHGGHVNVKEYYAAKANIARFQKKGDAVFFLKKNPTTARLARLGRGRKFPVPEKGEAPFHASNLKLKGVHMYQNALAAAAAARYLGVSDRTIKRVATGFRGVPHRLELVRRIGKIEFYNDSIATSPEAAAAGVRAFSGRNIILLAGGYDKGFKYDYKPLTKALKGSQTKLVVLFGQNKKKIQKAVRAAGVPTQLFSNLGNAVKIAHQAARKLPSAAVLLSPGAKSFDQFKSYVDRGQKFKEVVGKLKS